ncbi:MAG: HAMP domain-containing sensor histidine kinase [Pseudomonadota bacterium]
MTLKMIDDLLGLTRAEHLEVEHLQPVFYENIIESTIDQLMPQATQKQIGIAANDIEPDVWVSADSSLLERAFVNVVGNAIKYSAEGTKVTLSTRVEDSAWIITEVTDQGIGIPANRIGKLFERFHRDPNVQKEYKGTGLGLALVATVVREHGGQVEARSEENVGTTITIKLPILEIESDEGEDVAAG